MKKSFLQTIRIGLFLGFLCAPTQNWCAVAADPENFQLYQPSPLHQIIEESIFPSQEPKPVTNSGVDTTYAVKNLLSSIMETFPGLTVQEALSRSALLGIIAETEVQLHMYGTFTTKPDPHDAERTIKVFDTHTPLNKVTRAIFDILDEKLRPTVLGSNPFVGLNGRIIAKIMLILTNDGIQGLLDALTTEKKPPTKKGEGASPEPEELSLLDEWWESYRTSGLKRLVSKGKFLTKIIGSKKDSEEEVPFIKLLKEFASNPTESAHPKEDLAKILMTFLCLKNQSQKTNGSSHALKEYYTALLGREFAEEHYTRDELDTMIKQALTGEESSYTIGRNPKGLEDTTSYLAHFTAGDFAFLHMPYERYISATKNFAYCAEATTRSIMNSILYNPKKRMLDIEMLPPAIRKKMNPRFLQFIQENPNPAAPGYYGISLEEWLNLVSGVKGVTYMQGSGEEAYEMDASPEDLVTVLNHIFGTTSDSLEAFGKAISFPKKLRAIVFVPADGGFYFQIKNDEDVIINAYIEASFQGPHSSFSFRTSILELLSNEIFHSSMDKLSDYSQQNLYGLLFKPSTLNIRGGELLQAIGYWPELVKTMLFYGANPNFYYDDLETHTPLEYAVSVGNDEAVYELLGYGALITKDTLTKACATENFELIKAFLPLLKKETIDHLQVLLSNENYSALFIAIKLGQYDLVHFFIEHSTHLEPNLLLNIAASENFNLDQKIQLEKQIIEKTVLFLALF